VDAAPAGGASVIGVVIIFSIAWAPGGIRFGQRRIGLRFRRASGVDTLMPKQRVLQFAWRKWTACEHQSYTCQQLNKKHGTSVIGQKTSRQTTPRDRLGEPLDPLGGVRGYSRHEPQELRSRRVKSWLVPSSALWPSGTARACQSAKMPCWY
jgi:hypothetical protein